MNPFRKRTAHPLGEHLIRSESVLFRVFRVFRGSNCFFQVDGRVSDISRKFRYSGLAESALLGLLIRSMSQPDSSNQNREPEMKPSGNAMPSAGKTPAVPPLPHSRKSI